MLKEKTKGDPNMLFTETPEKYLAPCAKAGALHHFTYESECYTQEHRKVTKNALVYLPYGYEDEPLRRYPVLYLMHGGGGDYDVFFGGQEGKTPLKTILDNVIAEGLAQPMIVVTPTFTVPGWPEDQRAVGVAGVLTERFPQEVNNDLLRAVDAAFRTVPERHSRAFGGFSMGGETTWRVMAGCLDKIGVYMPLSGDYWAIAMKGGADYPEETADALVSHISTSGVPCGDYRVLAFTGDKDIAFAAMDPMVKAIGRRAPWFTWGENPGEGNICYCLKKDGLHTYEACYEYIYLALPHLFK